MSAGSGELEKDWEQGLLIPRDMPWKDIHGHGFRVERFLPLASIERGKVKGDIKFLPYAVLGVESPAFDQLGERVPGPQYMMVVHKVDFRHFWELYNERGVNQGEEEVIVSYYPSERTILKILGSTMPHLRIEVRPKGSLEEIYKYDDYAAAGKTEELLERTRTIAEWDPMDGRIK